ncbi:MAG: hypothetical protein AAFO07_18685 [Bacteroidota bacterium]
MSNEENPIQPTQGGTDPKMVGIVAYITLIGWVIALLLNNSSKSEFASFHIRQALGLILMSFVSFIPVLGWIIAIGAFILWIVALIGAIQGKQEPVPIVGQYFQEWFKSI